MGRKRLNRSIRFRRCFACIRGHELDPDRRSDRRARKNTLDSAGNRQAVTVSMKALSEDTQEGRDEVETILRLDPGWIARQEAVIADLTPRLQPVAARHIDRAREALRRMYAGWTLVNSSDVAARAFRWANEAMLVQQVRSSFPLRRVERGKDGVLHVVGPHPDSVADASKGSWRPFQIAFLLASLPELIEPSRSTRTLVDLIFFPTGGGKTEAYLGASAISLLVRRLREPSDAGTDTLMRYTLRLLTSQNFYEPHR